MQPGFPKLMTAIHDAQSALVSSHKKGRPSRSRTAFILAAYLKSASVSNLLPCISVTLRVPARIMLIVIFFELRHDRIDALAHSNLTVGLPVQSVPALGGWGLGLLAFALGFMGVRCGCCKSSLSREQSLLCGVAYAGQPFVARRQRHLGQARDGSQREANFTLSR